MSESLSGFVHYSNGNPVSTATVNYYAAIEGTPSTSLGSTTTNANGYWEFTGVTPGLYDVRASWDAGAQIRWIKGLAAGGISSGARLLDVAAGDVTVSNTVTETDLYSLSIPANLLSTNRTLRLTLLGDLLANAVDTPIVRVKFGASTLIATAVGGDLANSASRRAIRITVHLCATSNAAQVVYMEAVIGSPDTDTTGTGARMNPADAAETWWILNNIATGAIDSTAAQTFAVSWEWSAASASTEIIVRHANLELLS